MTTETPTIKGAGPDDLTLIEQPPIPGVERRMAFAGDDHWAGLVTTDAGMDTGWHHHGDYDTYVYVLKGRARVEWGPGGSDSTEVGPGSFGFVPKGLIHREINPGDDTNEVVVIRVGTGIPVFPTGGPEEA